MSHAPGFPFGFTQGPMEACFLNLGDLYTYHKIMIEYVDIPIVNKHQQTQQQKKGVPFSPWRTVHDWSMGSTSSRGRPAVGPGMLGRCREMDFLDRESWGILSLDIDVNLLRQVKAIYQMPNEDGFS